MIEQIELKCIQSKATKSSLNSGNNAMKINSDKIKSQNTLQKEQLFENNNLILKQ